MYESRDTTGSIAEGDYCSVLLSQLLASAAGLLNRSEYDCSGSPPCSEPLTVRMGCSGCNTTSGEELS